MRASETSEVMFEGCRIPASQLLGQEGQGFVNALQVLDAGRIGIAALAVGLAQGAYDAARGYAFQRQAVRPADRHVPEHARQAGGRGDAHRGGAAADLSRGVAEGRRARDSRSKSAMAKLYSSEIAVRVSEDGVQIHGGYGFVKDYPAEKFFRDVKLTTIGEGTSEIQRLVIARQLLALDKSSEARLAPASLGPRSSLTSRRPRPRGRLRARVARAILAASRTSDAATASRAALSRRALTAHGPAGRASSSA